MPPSPDHPDSRWHHLSGAEVTATLGSHEEHGLPHGAVEERHTRFGPNALSAAAGRGPVARFLLQFHAPLVYVLLVAAVLAAAIGALTEALVVAIVIVVNAVLGHVQESRALDAIESLSRRMASDATVVRAGQPLRVPARELVPGDVVLLAAGDKVPADVRWLRGDDVHVDESALTGESVASAKHPRSVHPDAALPDRSNMAYASTFLTRGQGRAIVVATGNRTEMGRISRMISSASVLATPLTRKIASFSQVLLVGIVALAVVAFALSMVRGESAADALMVSIALAVGAVPEGLPAAVTIILAIGVARMARHNALIRKLPAVETLGSTTVIGSDKTGTLTQNQMTVQQVITADGAYAVSGDGYEPEGRFTSSSDAPEPSRSVALRECVLAGLHCNDARLVRGAEGWAVEGDPTEGALVVSARKLGLHEATSACGARLATIPFESEHQYMATLHAGGDAAPPTAYVKGSVERVLARCVDALDARGERVPLDAGAVERAAHAMASGALRVLAFARVARPEGSTSLVRDDVESGLTFLGLQGMMDPPRPEAVAAVRACKSAGVEVKMITGDHAETGAAVAQRIGLGKAVPSVLTGRELDALGDDALARRLPHVDVFARVAPEHKLRIVRALQEAGHVVAMTGDGVNDAPALKQADIGVAMGRSGTDVAKDAADMVLTDDDFSSIAAAVEEGRGVFDNLRKFIVWTIPTNAGEGLVILAALVFGVALPILPLQILWINLTTTILLGTPLAFEKKEDVMARPPRDPRRPLLTFALFMRSGLVSLLLLGGAFGLYSYEVAHGQSLEVARTVAVNVFVAVESIYLLSCRSLLRSPFAIGFGENRWVLAGIGVMFLFALLFTYAPWMNALFESAPLELAAWLRIGAVAGFAFAAVELEKWIRGSGGESRDTNSRGVQPTAALKSREKCA